MGGCAHHHVFEEDMFSDEANTPANEINNRNNGGGGGGGGKRQWHYSSSSSSLVISSPKLCNQGRITTTTSTIASHRINNQNLFHLGNAIRRHQSTGYSNNHHHTTCSFPFCFKK